MGIKDSMPSLAVFLVLGGVVAAAELVVYIILSFGADGRVGLPLRLLFRIYLYLISIVLLANGASAQKRALGSPWPVSEGVRTL